MFQRLVEQLRGIATAGCVLLSASSGCTSRTSELWVETQGSATRYDQSACQVERPYALADFVEVEPFESRDCLQESWCSWYPYRMSGQPVVGSRKAWEQTQTNEELPVVPKFDAGERLLLDGVAHVLQVSDGWLIALSKDAAGQLLWVNPDGTRGDLLAHGEVTAYHRFGDTLFAVQPARVLRVAKGEDGRWSATAQYTPAGVIHDSARLAQSMLLLEDAGVKELATDGQVRVVHLASWAAVQPNRLLSLGNGVMLIGAHHVVIQLEPQGTGYSEKWLTLPGCGAIVREPASNRCFCRG